MELNKILNLKVVAIKGFELDRRITKRIEPRYILFDDGKTYIELEEQDYHTYHDCSTCARVLNTVSNEDTWKMILDGYPDANIDI